MLTQDIDKLENLPSRVNMRPKSEWPEHQDYPWKKVQKWLEGQVGRPWNHVTSDFFHLDWILEKDKTFATIERHVEVNTFLKDKKVFVYASCGKEVALTDFRNYTRFGTLYVHPKSQVLSIFKKQKIKEAKKPVTFISLGDYHTLEKVDGIWYEFKAIQNPNFKHWHPDWRKMYNDYYWKLPYPERKPVMDKIGPTSSLFPGVDTVKNNLLSCMNIKKKQLNYQELKKRGLKNH